MIGRRKILIRRNNIVRAFGDDNVIKFAAISTASETGRFNMSAARATFHPAIRYSGSRGGDGG